MFEAFDLAERYQVPVVVLTEQALGHRRTDLPKAMLRDLKEVFAKRVPQEFDPTSYFRFALTESGVSPRAVPGDKGGAHVVTGLEHGENGAPRHDEENRKVMMDKRWRKLDAIAKEHGTPWRFGSDTADIGIIGWGATAGAVREAVEVANNTGLSVAAIYPKILYPNPDEAIRPFIRKHRVIIVLEENQTGQYANFLQSIYGADLGFKPERINKYDGAPFRPDDVLAGLRDIAARHGIKTPAATAKR
jgi:2-oxoglutarate ferredoxin oxidoreductase subunit alpha